MSRAALRAGLLYEPIGPFSGESIPAINPLPNVRIRRGQPTPGQREDFTRTHPGHDRKLGDQPLTQFENRKTYVCTSFMVITRRTGFAASLGVNSNNAGLRSTCPQLRPCRKSASYPTEDDRPRKTTGRTCAFSSRGPAARRAEARKLPRAELPHQMNRHPVHVVVPSSSPSTSGCNTENKPRPRTRQTPNPVLLALGIDLGNDPIHNRPRIRFGHILDQTDDAAFPLRSTHHIATQRPRCFLTEPFWYRHLRIEFLLMRVSRHPELAMLSGYHLQRSALAVHVRFARSRRYERLTPHELAPAETDSGDRAGIPARGRRSLCETWAFEQ
jgi:hypothetical protein